MAPIEEDDLADADFPAHVRNARRFFAEMNISSARDQMRSNADNGGVMYAKAGDAIVTDNHPLRAGKGTIYEGGTRVPCIVAWPGTTGADTRSDAVISSIDFYPTILDMLGLKPRPDQKFDGISIVPALRGQPVLAAQEIEDVVAFLLTLRDAPSGQEARP